MMSQKSRNWIFTWNNYPNDYATALDNINCRYIIAGKEVAPNTATPHLQGYVIFLNAIRLPTVRTQLPGCHVEIARGNSTQCIAYCSKEDPNPYCRGDKPKTREEIGDDEKKRWEQAWDHAKAGRIEEISADIRIRQYSAIKKIAQDYMPPLPRLEGPCGTWIVGAAGSGKTRAVLDQHPDAYPKPRNQWWDGYQREPIVLVDDIDIFDVRLGGKLKHWADAYPFIGESKGTSVKIRPQRIIVTSQYKIEEIWTDQETRQALLRRFIVIEKKLGEEINLL